MDNVCLFQLLYVSEASASIGQAETRAILAASRRNNRRLDVTGCLLISDRYFAQALEGDASTVKALTARIASDNRHTRMRVILEREVERRRYAGWDMGYVHRQDLADELQNLIAGASIDAARALAILDDIAPDTVAGAL